MIQPKNWFIRLTGPAVRRLARAYGLRVEQHCVPLGEHPLVIEDSPAAARHNIPRSVVFNTRSGTIRVGAGTVFGEDVMLLTGKHLDVEEASTLGLPHNHVPTAGRDITIGRGCYLGARAIVVGAVTIGDYAVVGAGAVVTTDVPPRTFVAGVPARIVRTLTSEQTARSENRTQQSPEVSWRR